MRAGAAWCATLDTPHFFIDALSLFANAFISASVVHTVSHDDDGGEASFAAADPFLPFAAAFFSGASLCSRRMEAGCALGRSA